MNRYVIITPCYNEENIIQVFLGKLEKTLEKTNKLFTVVVVDDCSTDSSVVQLKDFNFQTANHELKVLKLKYNVGHQAAIRQGLRFAANIKADGYIVMDSDGEDDPEAINKLVNMPASDIIFVSRGKRNEDFIFKLGYFVYKVIFKIISGNNISFGNYSMISKSVIESLFLQHFEHYSAFLSKSKYEKVIVKFDRNKRYDGNSKMKLKNLIFHGLKSLIEYSEEFLIFFMKILVLMVFIFLIYGGYIIYSKFISHDAIPGWTSSITLGLINAILIISGIIVLGLLILSNKNSHHNHRDIYSEI